MYVDFDDGGVVVWGSARVSPISRVFRVVLIVHCGVDLRPRRMWAASYRLTRLEMNEHHSDYDRGGQKGLFWPLSLDIFCSIHLISPKFCERSGIGQT